MKVMNNTLSSSKLLKPILFGLGFILLTNACDRNKHTPQPDPPISTIDTAQYEDSLIKNYIDSLGLNATKTSEGIYLVTTRSRNSNIYPDTNSRVKVDYQCYSLNGTIYDSSYDRGKPNDFYLSGVMKGFQIGIINIEVGGAATFFVPSRLGWGSEGLNTIPPNEILIFDVELLEIL
jgi:hypothetical protein